MEVPSKAAQFTAIISDLHLCEEEPVNLKFPLWKKYKTKEFFFDDVFERFLKHLPKLSGGEPIELILNGDIFDFDSVITQPSRPHYRVSRIEKKRGLHPQEQKSVFKIRVILSAHKQWIEALGEFVKNGNRIVFVYGNHDLELHFKETQKEILSFLRLDKEALNRVIFTEWFYISNEDTLVEHGNQYDPYCRCEDPVNPFIERAGYREVRLPFGSWATRYIVNGLGYFNPHVDSNFIMSFWQYLKFFVKYMARSQPALVVTWMGGSFSTLKQTILDQLHPAIRDPLSVELRIEDIARRSNATPSMVRQLTELFLPSAGRNPWLIARELWLDRAAILLGAFYILFNIYIYINALTPLSIWWLLIPSALVFPPFLFYSSFVHSDVARFKEPQERILSLAALITKVQRIVYGHTHISRHEMIGAVEHLNSGTWSPAFTDVECKNPIDQKTFVWIYPSLEGRRTAKLLQFKDGSAEDPFHAKHNS